MQQDLEPLFETTALRVCPPNEPFWYVSGLIGVFYINTHYLCGGEENAVSILSFIDEQQGEPQTFAPKILGRLQQVYESSSIYKAVIDASASKVAEVISSESIDYISGGQRRDWFFAPIIAQKLDVPCLYLYNDKSIFDGDGQRITDLGGASVLNIADLLMVGASYSEKWAPAVSDANGQLVASFNIVNRNQGGRENLMAAQVKTVEQLYSIDKSFFELALASGYITKDQFDLVVDYLADPDESMRAFLKSNPKFVAAALESENQRTRQRAEKLVANSLYGEL